MFSNMFPMCCCASSKGDGPAEVVIEAEGVMQKEKTEEKDPKTSRLWIATANGDMPEVEELLAAGVDVNAADPVSTPSSRNITPLVRAARAGHVGVVRSLLQVKDIDVNAYTTNEPIPVRSRQAALHWACREGRTDVVSALLTHPNIDVNMKTQLGYTALQVASQVGHADAVSVLVKDPRVDIKFFWTSPSKVEMDALKVATFEGHDAVARVLVNTGRADGPDLSQKSVSVDGITTPVTMATLAGHPAIARVLLEAKGSPDIPDEQGRTSLGVALDTNNTEIVLNLLCAGADASSCFTRFHEEQILGNAKTLQKLYQSQDYQKEKERFPALHEAVLGNKMPELTKAIAAETAAGKYASDLDDGGGFPALYWAIELGYWEQVEVLLSSGHSMPKDFASKLLAGGFGPITKAPSEIPGERVFEVCRALLANDAAITADKVKAKGAFKLLQPFCASVPALQYFQKHTADFDWLRETCLHHSNSIYVRVDAEVGLEALKRAAQVAKDENFGSIRQDDPELLPLLEYIANEETGQRMAGNHELFAARSLALAGMCINKVFMEDMRALLEPAFPKAGIHPAPPKAFSRMYNKLQNKLEHGDPTIPKPRPMKNVDINRLAVSVDDADDVDRIYKAIKSKYKILRVKNTHDPSSEGYGAYRSLLVNFAYEPGLSYREVFGLSPGYQDFKNTAGASDQDSYSASDATSQKWLDHVKLMKPAFDWLWGLQGLWRVARKDGDRPFRIAAEVQIILKPYMRGRLLSHLMYKISRCETGPSEMARDFARGFQEDSPELIATRESVINIAGEVRAAAAAAAAAAAKNSK